MANRRDFDGVAALRQGLERVAATLASLRPGQAGYENLRAAYRRYRELAAAGTFGKVNIRPRKTARAARCSA